MKISVPFHDQRGIASIYVMLIFVAASVIISGLLGEQHLELDRTAQFLDEEQAMQYALGAEAYARQLLYDDTQNHGADFNGEWNGKLSPFAIADGTIEINMEDLRGRFNVNSLLSGDQAQAATVYFQALCTNLGIAESSVNAVLAGIQQLKPAPLTPGSAPPPPVWMADASELVDHLLPMDDYLKLAPYVAALPSGSYAVNINTASDPVLLSYLGDAGKLSAVHAAIRANGYIGNDQLPQFENSNNSLKIGSDAFDVRVTVRMNGHVLRLSSTVLRAADNDNEVLTIARKWGE